VEVNEASAIMVAERIDSLPVIDAGRLVGIITSTDVLGHVAQSAVPLRAEPTVGQLMIRNVQAVFSDDPLADAAGRMAQHGIRHLPVVDGELRVRGILSERDVREATGQGLLEVAEAERSAWVRRQKVKDVMTAEPRTITEEEPLANAVRALVEDRFGALPVVDADDHLLGILSYVDLLRYLGARLAAD
jgi:CBS domain-containing protein